MRQNTKEAATEVRSVRQSSDRMILQVENNYIGLNKDGANDWIPVCGSRDLEIVERRFFNA